MCERVMDGFVAKSAMGAIPDAERMVPEHYVANRMEKD